MSKLQPLDLVGLTYWCAPSSLCLHCRAVYNGYFSGLYHAFAHSTSEWGYSENPRLAFCAACGHKENIENYIHNEKMIDAYCPKCSCNLTKLGPAFTCQVCRVVSSEQEVEWRWKLTDEVPHSQRPPLEVLNIKELGEIAAEFSPYTTPGKSYCDPLELLFRAIAAARWFIHFATFSVDTTLLGALRLASYHGVSVHGIVGNTKLHNFVQQEIRQSRREEIMARRKTFDIRVCENHSKLIVIDGLIAFKGSSNLTSSSWRKASSDVRQDLIESVAQPDTVIELNNSLFAPAWIDAAYIYDPKVNGIR